MTKQVPYHELEIVNGARISPIAIMFAIGKREVHLEISDSWPISLQNLLQACWEDKEENRPCMGEIISMIEKIPTSNPDYVMVGAPKKTTNLSNIEKIKNILNLNLSKFDNYFSSDKPKAPPRKQINKHDIGEPTGFTRLFSIGLQNGEVEVHDRKFFLKIQNFVVKICDNSQKNCKILKNFVTVVVDVVKLFCDSI